MIFYTCIGLQEGMRGSQDLRFSTTKCRWESNYITIVLQTILNTRVKDVLYSFLFVKKFYVILVEDRYKLSSI